MQVGKTISTKSVGSSVRSDVTQSYKFEEGSELERISLGTQAVDKPTDVELEVKFSQQVSIGENFNVAVMVRYMYIKIYYCTSLSVSVLLDEK